MRIQLFPILLGLLAPAEAIADAVLILANGRYEEESNIRAVNGVADLGRAFEAAGFDVILVEDGTAAEMRAGLSRLLAAEERQRMAVVTAGHYAASDWDTWLAAVSVDAPDLATMAGDGLSLSVIAQVLASTPGQGVLLVAEDPREIELGAGLRPGLGPVDLPQGVTLIRGPMRDLARFAAGPFLEPGGDLVAAIAAAPDLAASGFLSPVVPFRPASAPVAVPDPVAPDAEELALWQAAEELNTPAAYRAYLDRYPNGAFAALAAERSEAPSPTPEEVAAATEEALGLDRDGRREVQAYLTVLGYDTRGIDGIFGSGSRSAIADWQAARGFTVTGYLTEPGLAALRAEGQQRQAEIEEEERLRREAEERADRAYWQATGEGQTEDGLRSYLSRYPEGLYSEVAQARLDQIVAGREAEAWQAAQQLGTEAAYQAYLETYPEGPNAATARARLDELRTGLSADQRARYEAQEAALNLQPITRSLVEQRLAAIGLDPGAVDGVFDTNTRRALRRYQTVRGLEVSGYLDQITLVRLLAESINTFLR